LVFCGKTKGAFEKTAGICLGELCRRKADFVGMWNVILLFGQGSNGKNDFSGKKCRKFSTEVKMFSRRKPEPGFGKPSGQSIKQPSKYSKKTLFLPKYS